MAMRCSWCNSYIGDEAQYWFHNVIVDGREVKSEQKFCSPKCSHEYPYQATPENSGCFIATAVYGNYDHPVVLDLRFFRDNSLEQNKWGRSFINFYYKFSPYWADIISKSKLLRILAFSIIIFPLHLLVKTFKKSK